MKEKMLITINDYQRLTGLIEFASLRDKMPDIVTRLDHKLKTAQTVAQHKIQGSVVTMNSRVLLTEMSKGRQAEVTITYPQDVDVREGKISVFSPIGVALLGCCVGDNVSWKVPSGIGQFQITKIVYHPEAVGHYHL